LIVATKGGFDQTVVCLFLFAFFDPFFMAKVFSVSVG